MTGYEKLIKMMRSQGAVYNSPGLRIGVMTSGNTCKIGNLDLDADDLYIAEHLLYKQCYKVDERVTVSNTHAVSYEDRSKYLEPLKSGDMVLAYQINDDKYVIIEKIVEVS